MLIIITSPPCALSSASLFMLYAEHILHIVPYCRAHFTVTTANLISPRVRLD